MFFKLINFSFKLVTYEYTIYISKYHNIIIDMGPFKEINLLEGYRMHCFNTKYLQYHSLCESLDAGMPNYINDKLAVKIFQGYK